MKGEKGQTIPGIRKLIKAETALKKTPKAQPKDSSKNPTTLWKPFTPEELRKLKRGAGVKYVGDVGK